MQLFKFFLKQIFTQYKKHKNKKTDSRVSFL